MILEKLDEIIELAKVYIEKYNLSVKKAIERAIEDIERRIENEEIR